MEPSKEEIKNWLRNFPDRDRHWLANLCEVDKRTVDNWLSSPREVPAKALVIIGRQMHADREAERAARPAPEQNLVLEVSPETFDRYNHAALDRGMIVRDWAVDALNQAARRQPKLRAIAEDSPPYTTAADAAAAERAASEAADSVDSAELPPTP